MRLASLTDCRICRAEPTPYGVLLGTSRHPASGPFVPFTMKHECSRDRSLHLQLNSPVDCPKKKLMKGRHFLEASSLTIFLPKNRTKLQENHDCSANVSQIYEEQCQYFSES